MNFNKENDFEDALVKILAERGWERKTLDYYTEDQLIQNWANILFENNRSIDRLNDFPLTQSEMHQILEQIKQLKTPFALNGFINGGSVTIKRDNTDDLNKYGKEVTLKIYDRKEIAAGQSRYQIARQPIFTAKSKILNDRRGDLMLLINGMPVIHIELKKSGVPVSQAYHQIEKYSTEGVFTGLFSLVQVFVAMNPDETVYFANPGQDGKFNPTFYFHWADFNNEPINKWSNIATSLLSIPMAHQLIGFYTVADSSDGILKVMRSYQYFAASAISDAVAKKDWSDINQRGGYIWHTTGSGKTMTSFKSAQLIASSQDADKVIFLIDRKELGVQSLLNYQAFADDVNLVQATENTYVLISKLKSTNINDTLIVTSIQKLSNLSEDKNSNSFILNNADLEIIRSKRLVIIVDECHRSTFGDMMNNIKQNFPNAMFFGFTGTPIQEENQKKLCTTTTIFGNELHRYSIADGIRDHNVLGFDPYKILTYKDSDLRKAVALMKAKALTPEEALQDPNKKKIFFKFLNYPMAGYKNNQGKYIKGIEDYLPNSQYDCDEHHKNVIKDILDGWVILSHNSKFHALLATQNISEAISYYRLFKQANTNLNITALFDPNIDNNGNGLYKEDGLIEIIEDYNKKYNQDFSLANFDKMKKDISLRLAHKKNYMSIEKTPSEQINLLIVVDQMLTGFDSKWLNTLYLDKIIKYENIIQAFSRTNRLFDEEKPFGIIRYYRKPHTMEQYIEEAVKLYSGNKKLGLFVEKLDKNLEQINQTYTQIDELFISAGIEDFTKLPDELIDKIKFAQLFNELNVYLEAAKVQGFVWNKTSYIFKNSSTSIEYTINILLTKKTYKILVLRYKELCNDGSSSGSRVLDPPFDIKGYITEIDTADIDSKYINSKFEKFKKALNTKCSKEEIDIIRKELHSSFASLSQEDQKIAEIIIDDIERGDSTPEMMKTVEELINIYKNNEFEANIKRLVNAFGVDEAKLRNLISLNLSESNLNQFGRFDELKASCDRTKIKQFYEEHKGEKLPPPKITIKLDKVLRKFILEGDFDITK